MFAHKLKQRIKIKFFLLGRSLNTQETSRISYANASDYKKIPRPNTLTYIRDFLPGGEFQNASFFDYAMEMRKRFGDIYVLPGLFGKSDIVMTFNTKDFETVYRNEGQWPHRQIFESVQHIRTNVQGDFFKETIGLPIAQGESWGKMRSAVNPILMKTQNLNMYLKPIQSIVDEFIVRVKRIRDPLTLEVPGNFDKDIYRLIFEATALVALSRKLGFTSQTLNDPDAERLIECTQLNFEFVYKLDLQPSIWKYFRTPTYHKNVKVQADLLRITKKYIDETLKQLEQTQNGGGKQEKFCGVLEKLLLKDKTLAIVTAIDILTSGVDAATVTLAAILLCLAKNPQTQHKLRAEILKVMPTKEAELNETDMKNLPYLKAVFKEALRYYPNGSGPLRSPVQNVVLSGYQVPKGSTVVMNSNCLLKEETFFPQADTFLPERWLRNKTNARIEMDPFSYMPFGVGPRICVGKRLAELEIDIIVVKLIRNFEIVFNYDATKPFKAMFLNSIDIPLRFTFREVDY